MTARDFSQTLELCERFGIDHTAIGHHRGESHRLEGARPHLTLAGADPLGAPPPAPGAAVRPRPRPRLQRHQRRRRRAADPQRDDVRLRVGHGPAHDQLPAGAGGGGARGDPPERLARYGATGKLRRYEGLKEEYYLSDFEPDERVLEQLGLDRGPSAGGRPHAPGGVALPPLRERPLRRALLRRLDALGARPASCSAWCSRGWPPRRPR